MEQVKLTTGEYLLVTLPEDATWIEMDKPFTDQIVFESNGDDGKTVKLLPGQWEIIGRASELPTIGSGDLLIAVVENDMNPETTLIIRKI